MTYQETLNFLYSQLPMYQRVGAAAYKADLYNTIALCEALGNPQHRFKSIHIAGTNGKGSSSHTLAAIFQAAGFKTGLYTSPHLKNFTERIKIDGVEISQEFVVEFVAKTKSLVLQIKPSFFEITVAMAFDYFASQQIDIAIIEVGLGGRLDSTNVISPLVSLITNIGWDHMDLLGDTLPKIAAEKAGIIKPFTPVVISEYQSEVAQVFLDKALGENAPIYFASHTYSLLKHQNNYLLQNTHESGFHLKSPIHIALKGAHQLKNLLGVIKTIEIFNTISDIKITENALLEGIERVTKLTGFKGRWQQLSGSTPTFCDVGHNKDGLKVVLEQIATYQYEKLYFIFGLVKDKKHEDILELLPKNAYYFFCTPHIERGLTAQLLAQKAIEYDLKGEIIDNVNEAIAKARALATPQDLIFIGGSTFVVAEIDEL
jgi:dihydrofolate synthase/folylpolyglutamate synthase